MTRSAALLAGLLAATPCAAQDNAPARESAALKVANRTVIVLRGPIAGFSAKERVSQALERIEQALDAEQLPMVSTEEVAAGTRVRLGGKHAFFVTKIDIDESAGETTALIAAIAAKRLERAVFESREQATAPYLAYASALAAAATLAAGLVLWLMLGMRRWAVRRITEAASAHVEKLKVGGVPVIGVGQVLALARPLPSLAAWLAALLLAWAWLTFVLNSFPYTRPWGEQMGAQLRGVLGGTVLAILDAMPGLLVVAVAVIIARAVTRIARFFFDRVEWGRVKVGFVDAETAAPTRRIFSVVVWVFALAMAYPYLPGAHTEAFKGLSVLVGLMVSLGAASIVGQAFSGLTLMYNRSFRVGDYVRIGTTEGTVTELAMFMTRIRTGLGSEITLPNSAVISAGVVNYSRAVEGTGYVVDTAVTIGYSTPWRQVYAMLLEAARRTQGIAAKPGAGVRQTALSDYYVEYLLVAYSPAEQPRVRAEVLSDLHANIQDVFNEYGVQIMSPHYMMDPKEPQVVPKEHWHAPPAKPPEKQ